MHDSAWLNHKKDLFKPVADLELKVVQRTGFEPAKHYALGPHPSPFDHSGTSAWSNSEPLGVYQNGEAAEINPHSY